MATGNIKKYSYFRREMANNLGGLISDSSGSLYGETSWGGAYSGGIVFKLSRESNGVWKETILHSFGGPNDSYEPVGILVLDGSGNLYGVNESGGSSRVGTVFKLAPNSDGTWTERVLYSFQGYPIDGAWMVNHPQSWFLEVGSPNRTPSLFIASFNCKFGPAYEPFCRPHSPERDPILGVLRHGENIGSVLADY